MNYGKMNIVSPEKKRKVLKVGLMINSYNLFLWEYILINKLINSHYASIDLVVINKSHKVNRTFSEKVRERWNFLIFNFYNIFDQYFFKVEKNAFELKDASLILSDISTIDVKPISNYSQFN